MRKILYFLKNKKGPFPLIEKRPYLTWLRSLSISGMLQDLAPCLNLGLSRLPGFIGLVPPPALDKNGLFILCSE
jgi:hypothetical protein